jgi:hypothetical protein
VMLLAAGVVIGAVALTFFPKQQTAQAIACNTCNPHPSGYRLHPPRFPSARCRRSPEPENGTRFDLTAGLAGVISNHAARTEARSRRSDVKTCYNEQPGYAEPAEESLRHSTPTSLLRR